MPLLSALESVNELRWDEPRRVHFVGIGGAGMRSLAKVLCEFGWDVSGSDINCDGLHAFKMQGIPIYQGHSSLVVTNELDLVIHSDAIAPENVELKWARENSTPVFRYAEFLGQMSRRCQTIAVAGTHGKSTTTAMAGNIFRAAGLDPTTIYGASLTDQQPGGRAGSTSQLLVEACEYQQNFLHLHPDVALLLGCQWDHVDCYASQSDVQQAFTEFVERVPAGGLVVANADCPTARFATNEAVARSVTFGLQPTADWRASNLQARHGYFHFSIFNKQTHLCDASLRIAGKHNLMNALAAAAVAAESGISAQAIREGLSSFQGLHRRLEVVGTHAGVTLLDDYGHHPTEVAATLSAVRAMYPNRRLWCIFQPHQGDRTAAMLEDFASSLQNSDKLCIADVFQARPNRRGPNATAADLATCCRALGADASEQHTLAGIVELLADTLQAGDVLLTIGAGNIRNVIHEWTDRVRRYRPTG